MKIYLEPRDWWIGYYRGDTHHYVNEDLAEFCGVTLRTFQRDRACHSELNDGIKAARAELQAERRQTHGTTLCYAHGCRCDDCTRANTERGYAERMRARAARGLPAPDPRLGRPRKYEGLGRVRTRLERPVPIEERIEQAIASGRSTSQIMAALDVDYNHVKAVRDELLTVAS